MWCARLLRQLLPGTEHEVRENFKYSQTRVFSPHLELNNLVARTSQIEEGIEAMQAKAAKTAKAAKAASLCAV